MSFRRGMNIAREQLLKAVSNAILSGIIHLIEKNLLIYIFTSILYA